MRSAADLKVRAASGLMVDLTLVYLFLLGWFPLTAATRLLPVLTPAIRPSPSMTLTSRSRRLSHTGIHIEIQATDYSEITKDAGGQNRRLS